jgi:hypothetical protein
VIFGAWCGTGVSSDAPNQGSNTMGNFEMVKLPVTLKKPPTPKKK